MTSRDKQALKRAVITTAILVVLYLALSAFASEANKDWHKRHETYVRVYGIQMTYDEYRTLAFNGNLPKTIPVRNQNDNQ